MVANKLFAGFAVALALVSIATATKGPKDSGMRDTGTQNARDRKTLRRPQIPSPGPFPNIQPDERGLYEKSQEAANQCIEYYMHRLLHVDSSGANYRLAIEGCEERHGHIPQVSPSLKRELQSKADDYTEYNGILPNEDYRTMDIQDKEVLDQWLHEVDGHCRETWGTTARRGADMRVIRDGQGQGNGGNGNGNGGNNGGHNNNGDRQELQLIPEAGRRMRDGFFSGFDYLIKPRLNNKNNNININNRGGRVPAQNNRGPSYFNPRARPLRPL